MKIPIFCKFLLLPLAGFFSLNVIAQTAEIPFNTPNNSLEYKASANTYTWQPVTDSTPRSHQPYRADLSHGTASTVEPRAKWTPELPYDHKGGSSTKMNFTATASKAALAGAAAKEFAKATFTCAVKPGHPLIVSSQIAGCMGGSMLLGAALEWGWRQFNVNDAGDLTVSVLDPSYLLSNGSWYAVGVGRGFTPEEACRDAMRHASGVYSDVVGLSCYYVPFSNGRRELFGGIHLIESSPCPAGHYYSAGGQCFSFSDIPSREVPIADAVSSAINDRPWDATSAKVMAGVMMAGHNVFTDGTSSTITGPSTVPLGVSSESWPVNVLPGTTTEAPAGYTGATDPATKTSTTTKTANNTYSGNQQTTTTGTSTSTYVTNNVTNNSSSSVVTHSSLTNEAPKEREDYGSATDTPLPEIPELYKKKYPDGIAGVWRDFRSNVNQTKFINLVHMLTPDLGMGGTCPSWAIDLSWTPGGSMGMHSFGEDYCFIWPILRLLVLITALFTARRLIFGG